MNDNKTRPQGTDVVAWLEAVEPPQRRDDAFVLLEMMQRLSGHPPRMWGSSMIGFDQYHYKYPSGREGDMLLVGFSPRKANLAVYILPGFEGQQDLLARLGKHKTGKSCLYINRLADVDMAVLADIVSRSIRHMREVHH